ncbi:WXG100 family type VII secretion target [Nocardioides sp.]|uniref:WXG100 family type VII secretion target n=1 Tax=Nocardioides sp. TaxID=35761 RepID=UPI002735442D|nr:WXG100 family type VII secretion target [Nocardioides sp.]MDP3889648.1 WXG100 family type VII secretion target [Nocardioides sp.]
MDPVVMRGVADRMRTQAAQLEDVLSGVQRSVDEATSLWDGEDAHGFNGWWTSHYRPAISAAHTSLVEAAAALERNVREQERASGVGSGGGAGGGRPETDTPSGLLPFAESAYGTDKTLPDGWHDVGVNDLKRMGLESPPYRFEVKDGHVIIHTATGMDARLVTDDRGHYVLSFAGTTDMNDWGQNGQSVTSTATASFLASQAEDAANLAHALASDLGADNMVLTGHSLGGRNAAVASLAIGAQAVTYNAAGVTSEDILYAQTLGGHETSLGGYALSVVTFGQSDQFMVDDSRITNYVTTDDPLTYVQQNAGSLSIVLHDALGNQVRVDGFHGLHGHDLDSFKDKF